MRQITFIIISLLFSLNLTGQDFTPTRDVEATDDGIIVTYHFNGGQEQADPLHPGAKFWKIPGFALNDIAGQPATLSHYDKFAIPNGANAELELLKCEFTDTSFVLAPAIPPTIISDSESEISVPQVHPYTGFFPNRVVNKGSIQNYRGQKMIDVSVAPIQYDMEHGVMRRHRTLQYKLRFTTDNGTKVRGFVSWEDTHCNRISLTDNFVRNTALNYDCIEDINKTKRTVRTSEPAIKDNRAYLIITTDSLRQAAERFAEWKRTKGMNVFIESREIWSSEDSVKQTILQHYLQDSIMYVLNMGGINEIPAKMVDFHYNNNVNYNHVTDLYYAMLDNDQTIDVYVGRLLVSTLNEANIAVNKITKYEKIPTTSTSFYNRALHCAYFEDNCRKQINPNGTFNWIAGNDSIEDELLIMASELIKGHVDSKGKNVNRVYYTESSVYPLRWNIRFPFESPIDYPIRFFSGDTIPLYLQKDSIDLSRVSWNGNAADIVNYINEGCFYVLHLDHGSEVGWGHPCFAIHNISSLQNEDKLPVVFSINCLTGKYNTVSNCFAKKFLVKENGGCVGIFAPSRQSLSPINEELTISMFNAIWPTPTSNALPSYELAQILNFGMVNMNHQHNSYYNYIREVFHCFGDPSMMIYTDVPVRFSNPVIDIQNDKITVQTEEDSVRISFYNISNQHVDSYIGNYVEYPVGNDEVIVCLDKHNYIPHIRHCAQDLFIQNESVDDTRIYKGINVSVGKSVTSTKPVGDVSIHDANVKIEGKNVVLDAGTSIVNSNVEINTHP